MSYYRHNGIEMRYCPDIETPRRQEQWTIRTPSDVGRAIAGVRAARGMTQEELATLVGVHRSYLAKLEAGASALLLDRALRMLRRMGATVTVTLPERTDGKD